MSARWLRPVGGTAVLALLVWRLGTGPFLDGLHRVDARSVVLAAVLTLVGTVAAAWRWRVVAAGLGIDLALREAVTAYYRSMFLNTTLPGGVLGDVHRAVRHGQEVGETRTAVRAVVFERVAGQVVQVALAVVVLALVPSPVWDVMPWVGAALVLLALATLPWWVGRLSVRPAAQVAAASTLAVTTHVVLFVVAARTAGVSVGVGVLLPLAFLALVASSVPTNLAGWGPREGVAAWAFAGAGLGADAGLATSVVYGVLVLVSGLPGAVVLVLARRRHHPVSSPSAAQHSDTRPDSRLAGARHG